jgi:hypothetical protein
MAKQKKFHRMGAGPDKKTHLPASTNDRPETQRCSKLIVLKPEPSYGGGVERS